MKKISKLLYVLILSMLFIVSAKAKIIMLSDIADKINESSTINEYEKLLSLEIDATASEETLTVSLKFGEEKYTFNYNLNGSTLECDEHTEEDFFVSYFVVDAINQVHGSKDGEFLENVNLFADEIEKYTLEKEGFELNEDNGSYIAKMNILKEIPLVDLSEFYFKPEEFEFIKKIIEDEEVGNQTGANAIMAYDVVIGSDTDKIVIGEKGGLTDRSYKSILSALEVMYGKKALEDFKEVYPSFDEGNYVLDGYEIMLEEEIEEYLFQDKVNVVVTVNKDYAKDMFLRTEYIGEEENGGDRKIILDFANNEFYTLGFFDSVKENDNAFLIKNVLEPVFMEFGEELEDDTIYYNIVDGKIVIGDERNSLFKLVVGDEDIKLIPTNKENKEAVHSVKSKEYDSCNFGHQHYKNVNYNLTVKVKSVYSVLDGENQTVNTTKKDKLSFRFDIDFAKFIESGKVYIDENIVDAKNYETSEGSTIITFKDSFVKGLSLGKHEIKVTTLTGDVKTTFNVVKMNNPDTGDNIITYISLLGLSIISLVGIIYNKKVLD